MNPVELVLSSIWKVIEAATGWNPGPGALRWALTIIGIIMISSAIVGTYRACVYLYEIFCKWYYPGWRTKKEQELAEKIGEELKKQRQGGTSDASVSMDGQVDKEIGLVILDLKERAARGDDDAKAVLRNLKEGNDQAAITQMAELAKHQAAQNKARNHAAAKGFRELGAIAFHGDTTQALSAYESAKDFDPSIPEVWNQLGLLYFRVGDTDRARDAWQALTTLRHWDSTRWRAIATGNLGLLMRTRGELDRAEEFINESIRLSNQVHDKANTATQYRNLAGLHRARASKKGANLKSRLASFQAGIEVARKALELDTKADNQIALAADYSMLGVLLRDKGRLVQSPEGSQLQREAIALFEKGLMLARRQEAPTDAARLLHNIAISKLDMKDFRGAEALLLESQEINERIVDNEGLASCYGTLARIRQSQDQHQEAIELLEKSLALNNLSGRKKGLERDLRALRQSYTALGQHDKARRLHAT